MEFECSNFMDVLDNNIKPSRPFRVLDAFAGAGGLMLGLEKAGFEIAAAVEINKHACATLRINRPNLNVIEGDITEIIKEGIRNYIGDKEIDVLSGGYPCQAFSLAGKKPNPEDEQRTLFYWYAQLLGELKPKMFLVENIKVLLNHNQGKTLQGMLGIFDEIGYNVTYKVLKATDYNVAQKRERLFIIGIRKDYNACFNFPAPCKHKPVLRDILQNVPPSPGYQYNESRREIMKMIPPGASLRDLPIEIQQGYTRRGSLHPGKIVRRISWDEQCLNLSVSDMLQKGYCHPEETRPFTVREYARIQSFPDDWQFEGSVAEQHQQIGNALPVELARHVGTAMINTLNIIDNNGNADFGEIGRKRGNSMIDQYDGIIERAKDFFRTEIAPSHVENTRKLRRLKEFNLNPFLDKYKASFLTGNTNALSIAKALVYPRILGTSINTTFGNKLQKFCSEVLEGFASTTSGIDIEFVDKVDNRRKYCQIKAGPNTINKDDVPTIIGHFAGVRNLARTNNLNIGLSDLVVGVLYGTPKDLSSHYKKINEDYPVYVGTEFWYRLTGEEDFYQRLTDAIGEVASEYDSSELIEEIIAELALEIRREFSLEEDDSCNYQW